MRTKHLPYYCGGIYLYGLYNPEQYSINWLPEQRNDEFLCRRTRDCSRGKTKWYTAGSDPSNTLDGFHTVPFTLQAFQMCLKEMVKWTLVSNIASQMFGVMYAVTNPSQTRAVEYLTESKFKNIGTFQKRGGSKCINWQIDSNTLLGVLEKVPFIDHIYPEVQAKGKFG